jgi:hypothetical protein
MFHIQFLLSYHLYELLTVSHEQIKLPATVMQETRETRYSSYSFLTSTLDEGEWSVSRSGRTLPTGWASAGLDKETSGEILCLFRGSCPGCPVCSQILY